MTSFPLAGAVIATHRPHNPLGWMFLVIGLSQGLFPSATSTPAMCSGPRPARPRRELAIWVSQWAWAPGLGLLLTFVPLLFDGGCRRGAGGRFGLAVGPPHRGHPRLHGGGAVALAWAGPARPQVGARPWATWVLSSASPRPPSCWAADWLPPPRCCSGSDEPADPAPAAQIAAVRLRRHHRDLPGRPAQHQQYVGAGDAADRPALGPPRS